MSLRSLVEQAIVEAPTQIIGILSSVLSALESNPGQAHLIVALVCAVPATGIALKRLNKESEFIFYSVSRVLGKSIIIATKGAAFLSSVAVGCTYLYIDLSDYKRFDKSVFTELLSKLYEHVPAGILSGVIAGLAFYVFTRTLYSRLLETIEQRLTWRTLTRSKIPNESHVASLKPAKISQAKLKRWLKKVHEQKKVFIGVNERRKPIFTPVERAIEDCWQISGQPGSGKGVFNQLLFAQLIKFNHVNVVFNPKPDNYARSLLYKICQEANLPFYRLDLSAEHASINVLNGCSKEEVFEVFCSGLGYEDTAQESSYYKTVARRIIREVIDSDTPTSISAFIDRALPIFSKMGKDSANIENKLNEISRLAACQTEDASPLLDVFKNGGCLLIEGSPNNDSVLTFMKMLHVRTVQLASNRQKNSAPVNIWLDESKYLLCPSIINGLGTSRSFNFKYMLTVQSNADFEAVHLPFPPSAIREIINDDTPSRVIFSTRSRETAETISKHCGTRSGIAESTTTRLNELATETSNGGRKISTMEEPIFHPNLIQNLPKGIAILSGIVRWPILVSIPTLESDGFIPEAYVAPRFFRFNLNEKGDDLL